MASVFRRRKSWIACYKAADGQHRQRSAGSDKSMAQQIANRLETEAMLRRSGLVDPTIDRIAAAEGKSTAEHLTAFRSDIESRKGNYGYARQACQRAERIIAFGSIVRLSQLKAAAVNTAIAKLREENYGKASLAHHLRAIKMFSRWLWRNGHTADDALLAVKVPTVAASEKKIHRRSLSIAEFQSLLTSTANAATAYGMSGKDRSMLYTVAGSTGFRQSELRNLTPESFTLGDDPPTVTVKAAYSKRRKDDRQPISPNLAAKLKPWLEHKAAGKTVFAMPERYYVADMLRSDLEAARNAWLKETENNPTELTRRKEDRFLTPDGVDFHCLRVSYISWLVQSGANVKTCQVLARHSTPNLTIGLYARMSLNDQEIALAALPVPDGQPDEQRHTLQATGTDNTVYSSNSLAQLVHKTGDETGRVMANNGGHELSVLASVGSDGSTVTTEESRVFSVETDHSRPGGGMADAQDLKSCDQ